MHGFATDVEVYRTVRAVATRLCMMDVERQVRVACDARLGVERAICARVPVSSVCRGMRMRQRL
jgi:hypothetical protein